MNKITSYEEYKTLVNQFKSAHKNYYTNNYFMPDKIKRYIDIERAFYSESENALVLYFDENNYYRLCVFADCENDFTIPKSDKRLYLRTSFKDESPTEKLSNFENKLEKNGFTKVSTSIQIRGDIEELSNRLVKFQTFKKKLLDKGYKFQYATTDQYSECENILLASDVIKDYHIDYLTEHEKEDLIPGSYFCIIDPKGNMCGASICFLSGSVLEGIGIAIKNEYKLLGLAPILASIRFEWARERGAKSTEGWILLSNTTSIEYHKSMGYKFFNRYVNEWIFE